MVHIDLNMNKQSKPYSNSIDIKYVRTRAKAKPEAIQSQSDESSDEVFNVPNIVVPLLTKPSKMPESRVNQTKQNKPFDNQSAQDEQQRQRLEPKNIVEKIIADFAECETETVISEKQQQQQQQHHHQRINTQHNFNELIITCRNNADKPSQSNSSTKVRLLNHRSNRIISKSLSALKHNITKVDLTVSQQQNVAQCSASTNGINKNLDKAAKAYEFSEDNEKCEKISTFRKRRLADKKYEFSEDNTENIIPYNKMRSVVRNPKLHQKMSRHSPAHTNVMSYSSSPPSSLEMSASYHTHRASPSYGFRSPCGSPVGNRLMMMSPPGKLSHSYISWLIKLNE